MPILMNILAPFFFAGIGMAGLGLACMEGFETILGGAPVWSEVSVALGLAILLICGSVLAIAYAAKLTGVLA